MPYRVLADAVVVVHFAFILFVGGGALLAWRWPRLVWVHVPALFWAAASLTVGLSCPLTSVEQGLRSLAGGQGYHGGFIDHYLEGVIYPARYTIVLQSVAAVANLIAYAGLLVTSRRRARLRPCVDPIPRIPAPSARG